MATGAKTLSEISHLFLSNVKEKAGASRPVRTPPAAAEPSVRQSVDLSPEEFEQVVEAPAEEAEEAIAVPPVRAIIASHLGPQQLEAICAYAAREAQPGRRVGLIFVDVAEFRLSTFAPGEESLETQESGIFDPRAMRDAINELSCDLDQWIIAVGNVRVAEGRSLLRGIGHWVLLSACDQDGVVAAYRTLKGLEDLGHPRLGIAPLIEDGGTAQGEAAFRKLASVCGQFLAWAAEPEAPVAGGASDVGECQVMCCRTSHDKAQLASAAHWQVVEELAEQSRKSPIIEQAPPSKEKEMPPINPSPRLARSECESPSPRAAAGAPVKMALPLGPTMAEVIDLGEGEESIASAMMRRVMGELIECPVRAPMCAEARLAVTRERRLVLIAEAGEGLCHLNAIALAYNWVVENRPLLCMALPQFSLDVQQMPQLRLIVEHGQWNAGAISPLFQADAVCVHTYRRLRWGERTGLLLEAA